MMKKLLSSLLIGTFVFGVGAVDIQVADAAAPFKKHVYSRQKPKPPEKDNFREQTRQRPHFGKTQRVRW